ncbi:MAG: hypothetical protein HQL37_02155 [Alphaproteobacteria bacterium]|nr:hypothetical protein [Alphaproteobacteria bacterium]
MPPKNNPLKLNPLQLRTLTLLQEFAGDPEVGRALPESGEVEIDGVPHPHGDHFHVGHSVVMARDASGLHNESVWKALDRKGLIRSTFPNRIVLTREGLAYDTGLREAILHRSSH